jgi:hypothetical protein
MCYYLLPSFEFHDPLATLALLFPLNFSCPHVNVLLLVIHQSTSSVPIWKSLFTCVRLSFIYLLPRIPNK